MNKTTVLYIAIDPYMGGSTASLYDLIESVRETVNPIVLFKQEGEGLEFFRSKGIESYAYPFIDLTQFYENRLMDIWQHPWRWHYIKKWRNETGCVRYVKSILKGRKIDIVHTNTSPNEVGIKLAKAFHAKHIWHVRECLDIHSDTPIYRGMPYLIRKINSADGRIAISQFVADHWQMKQEDTWVINDASRSKKEACYIPKKDKYILFCAYNLIEAKGTRDAIKAFAKSGMSSVGYMLKLIGNCEENYRKSLVETATELGVKDSVEFVPCQKDVKPYFEHAAAYVMASKNEGLGRVTAEAMFYGCPVIAYASGGTVDIVHDRETGYLYNTLDECSTLIRKVSTEDQEEMIMRAQEFAVDNLSQEVYGPKIMEVYRKILNSNE